MVLNLKKEKGKCKRQTKSKKHVYEMSIEQVSNTFLKESWPQIGVIRSDFDVIVFCELLHPNFHNLISFGKAGAPFQKRSNVFLINFQGRSQQKTFLGDFSNEELVASINNTRHVVLNCWAERKKDILPFEKRRPLIAVQYRE